MSDRLTDLHRQRALIQGQLEWIDQEIAREQGSLPRPPASVTPTPARPAARTTPVAVQDPDAIISQFGSDTKNEIQGVKKGCFIAFGVALTLLALVVFGIYLYTRSRR